VVYNSNSTGCGWMTRILMFLCAMSGPEVECGTSPMAHTLDMLGALHVEVKAW